MAPPSPGFNHIPVASGAGSSSGDQVFTGRFHTDGKAIYRKVFSGTLNGSAAVTITHGVTFDSTVTINVILGDVGQQLSAGVSYYGHVLVTATEIVIDAAIFGTPAGVTDKSNEAYVATIEYTI